MGVGVMQTKNEVFLEQSAYTKALLCRFGMDKANSVATPVDVHADLVTTSDEVEDCDKDLYQSAVDKKKASLQSCSEAFFKEVDRTSSTSASQNFVLSTSADSPAENDIIYLLDVRSSTQAVELNQLMCGTGSDML
ncbi:hypothetical protein FHG87_020121 [Trinorchestia longiramus]|nr:hypothetical protein FHG87_020121 [Trinorchestia longiramus]